MTVLKKLVISIYATLIPHEELIKWIQSLLLWHKPVFSVITLLIIELIFVAIYKVPFSRICNMTITIGIAVLFYCIYSSFPSFFNKMFSFQVEERSFEDPRRIRTIKEIAAYLSTCISYGVKLLELALTSVTDSSFFFLIYIIFILVVFFVFTFFAGDFWFFWIVFHLIFVLPGIILLPPVQNWLNDPEINQPKKQPQKEKSENVETKEDKEEKQNE